MAGNLPSVPLPSLDCVKASGKRCQKCAPRKALNTNFTTSYTSSNTPVGDRPNGVTLVKMAPGAGVAQGKPKNAGFPQVTNGITYTNNKGSMTVEKEKKKLSFISALNIQEGVTHHRGSTNASNNILDGDDLSRDSLHPRVLDDSTMGGSFSYSDRYLTQIADDDDNYEEIGVQNKLKPAHHAAQECRHLLCLCSSQSKLPEVHNSGVSLPFTASAPSEVNEGSPLVTGSEKTPGLVDEDGKEPASADQRQGRSIKPPKSFSSAQQMTRRGYFAPFRARISSPELLSGRTTPTDDHNLDDCLASRPHRNLGILANIFRLHDSKDAGPNRDLNAECISYPESLYLRNTSVDDSNSTERSLSQDSGIIKPPNKKWWEKNANKTSPPLSWSYSSTQSSFSNQFGQRPPLRRSRSSSGLMPGIQRFAKLRTQEDALHEMCITVQLAETLSRQRYLLRLCKALMKYGAPTHRLEECMRMSAKVLDIDGQFLYIPGCMVISFDDATTHTADVKLVKAAQGVDLGRLFEVHQIYKEVIHDVLEVTDATKKLEEIMKRKPRFNIWFLILMHGFASASVGPFAFGARPIDMPVAFLLGCLLGILQEVLSPRSYLYSNVSEISAAVLTSFLARAFGSIPYRGGHLFCFSALAQSSIALILPGYMVLCGSLELQSRSIVAGSVRMVYSIIYSLFLGFGITVGTSVYGLLDPNASSDYYCPPSPIENPYLQRLPFVIMFTFCLAAINQSKWRQMPVMLVISLCGYLTTYCSTKRFGSNTQVVNALGAFVIGVMGNLYSRLRHGVAAAAILPAIFVQVPSGLAASGSLVSGITSADEINHNTSWYSIINNGTQGFLQAQQNLTLYGNSKMYSGVVFDIGYGMVQVAIGITVGLFLATLVVYPLGKKRSGLFSF